MSGRRGISRPYFPHARPYGFLATVTVRDTLSPFLSEFSEILHFKG